MERFIRLFENLDSATKTGDKLSSLTSYFKDVLDEEALTALMIITGKRRTKRFGSNVLRQVGIALSGVPPFVFEDCYAVVGDLSETIALLKRVEITQNSEPLTLQGWVRHLEETTKLKQEGQILRLIEILQSLGKKEAFILLKIASGSFRVGVSALLCYQAVANVYKVPPERVIEVFSGKPKGESIKEILNSVTLSSQPYPFFLSSPLTVEEESLTVSIGPPEKYLAEWKWDGIRGQLLYRQGEESEEIFRIWSRGGEEVSDQFPELLLMMRQMKREWRSNGLITGSFVIDGEIVAGERKVIRPFNELQRRLGRLKPDKNLLLEVPVAFIAYDLLELNEVDLRSKPLTERLNYLKELKTSLSESNFWLSEDLPFSTWEELGALRKKAREFNAEGVMLKSRASTYQVGRRRGDWWKWKLDPYVIDGVLLYAQPGHGKRANLYTDYTFAVWSDEKKEEGTLTPFTKAYSGLTNDEILEVDKFIRNNTVQRFGPVRSVKPALVFEIGFEGITTSKRHSSGVALRFPRILRWRHDISIKDADTLADLKLLLNTTLTLLFCFSLLLSFSSLQADEKVTGIIANEAGHFIGSLDGRTVNVWREKEKNFQQFPLATLPEKVVGIAFSKASSLFAYATLSSITVLRVWADSSEDSGEVVTLAEVKGIKTRLLSLQFDPLGRTLLAGASDGRVYRYRFIDTKNDSISINLSDKLTERYVGHSSMVTASTFHPFLKLFISGDIIGNLKVWRTYDSDPHEGLYDRNIFRGGPYTDLTTTISEAPPSSSDIASDQSVLRILMSEDGEHFLVIRGSGEIEVWRTRGFQKLAVTKAHSGLIYSAGIAPSGTHFVTLGRDGYIRQWEFVSDKVDSKTLKAQYSLKLLQELPTNTFTDMQVIEVAFTPKDYSQLHKEGDNNLSSVVIGLKDNAPGKGIIKRIP